MVTEGDSQHHHLGSRRQRRAGPRARRTAQLRFRPVVAGPEPAGPAPSDGAESTGGAAPPTAPTPSAAPRRPTPRADRLGRRRPTSAARPTAPSTDGRPLPDPNAPPVTQEEAAAAVRDADLRGGERHRRDVPARGLRRRLQRGRHRQVPARPHDHRGHRDRRRHRRHRARPPGPGSSCSTSSRRAARPGPNYTAAHVGENVAFTLDGRVISAPTIQGAINGQTTITGHFDQETATELANQLKYGALPLTFTQATAQSISTELGAEQLKAGPDRRRHRHRAGLRLRAVLLPAARPGDDRQPRCCRRSSSTPAWCCWAGRSASP